MPTSKSLLILDYCNPNNTAVVISNKDCADLSTSINIKIDHIGTYEINTYAVKFIINDLEIYEENRTFIYGETLNYLNFVIYFFLLIIYFMLFFLINFIYQYNIYHYENSLDN